MPAELFISLLKMGGMAGPNPLGLVPLQTLLIEEPMLVGLRPIALACSLSLLACPSGEPPEAILGVCGNGVVESGEDCDDGNGASDDDCTAQCAFARCGDGIVRRDRVHGEPGFESCDDPNDVDETTCRRDCLFAVPAVLGGDRPAFFSLPPNYDPRQRYPLMVLLHGHGQTGALINRQMGGEANQEDLNYLLLIPEGTAADDGRQFWNATPACCNFFGSSVDDLAYLSALIDEAVDRLYGDPKRIYIMGLSNGGFMAERLACDAANQVTGIVNVGGSGFLDPTRCRPSTPVTYIRVHGTNDETIPFEGRHNMPGALACVERWRQFNGCNETVETSFVSLDDAVEGNEAHHQAWTHCQGGSSVHFFPLEGGAHVPRFTPASRRRLLELVMETIRP